MKPITSDGNNARFVVRDGNDEVFDCGAHGSTPLRELTADEQKPVADCAACVGALGDQ